MSEPLPWWVYALFGLGLAFLLVAQILDWLT
jgi:hypothetical protein